MGSPHLRIPLINTWKKKDRTLDSFSILISFSNTRNKGMNSSTKWIGLAHEANNQAKCQWRLNSKILHQHVWGHSPGCLVTFPKMFDEWHSLEYLRAFPGMFGNIYWNVWWHSPDVWQHSVTLPRMFRHIHQNITFPLFHTFCFPSPDFSWSYLLILYYADVGISKNYKYQKEHLVSCHTIIR